MGGQIQQWAAGKNEQGMQQDTSQSWRVMFYCAESVFVICTLFWLAAWYYAHKWVREGTPALRSSLLGGDAISPSPLLEPLAGDPDSVANPVSVDAWDEESQHKRSAAFHYLSHTD